MKQGKKINFYSVVEKVWESGHAKHHTSLSMTKDTLQLKEFLYTQQHSLLDRDTIAAGLLRNYQLNCFSLSSADSNTIELSTAFISDVRKLISEHGKVGNAYRMAAVKQFGPHIQRIVERGLSSVLPCDDLDSAHRIFMRDMAADGEHRPAPEESEVFYLTLSYRHEHADGLSPEQWKEAIKMTSKVARCLGYSKFRLWVDRITVKREMTLANIIAFLSYLIYPTFVHPNAERCEERL